ncbi:MAG: VOC family protein [Patescibacteria group bacterium]
MRIKGVHHIELTVTSLENSKSFYQKLPNFKVLAEYPDFVMFFNGNVYLGLTTHQGKAKGKFDEKNVGMDHVSFEVDTKEALEEAIKFFDKENIPHGEIKKLSNNIHVLAFRDPDNIQLELSWREA